jgi:hypothetical protein
MGAQAESRSLVREVMAATGGYWYVPHATIVLNTGCVLVHPPVVTVVVRLAPGDHRHVPATVAAFSPVDCAATHESVIVQVVVPSVIVITEFPAPPPPMVLTVTSARATLAPAFAGSVRPSTIVLTAALTLYDSTTGTS